METLDDSTLDNAEKGNQHANESKSEDAEDEDSIFFREVEVAGGYAGRTNVSENVM